MGCCSREPLAKGSVLGGDSFADLRTGGQALPAGCQRGLAAKGRLATPYVTSVRGAKTSIVWRLGLAVTGECRSRRSCSNFQCQSPRTPARPSTSLCKLQPPLPSPANQTSVQIAPRSRSALAARSDGPFSHGAASAPVKRLVPARLASARASLRRPIFRPRLRPHSLLVVPASPSCSARWFLAPSRPLP